MDTYLLSKTHIYNCDCWSGRDSMSGACFASAKCWVNIPGMLWDGKCPDAPNNCWRVQCTNIIKSHAGIQSPFLRKKIKRVRKSFAAVPMCHASAYSVLVALRYYTTHSRSSLGSSFSILPWVSYGIHSQGRWNYPTFQGWLCGNPKGRRCQTIGP